MPSRSACVGDEPVRRAAEALFAVGRQRELTVRGLLVEPMAEPGLELIVGLRRDPQFGPVVVVGLGGTLTEVLDDVAIRLAPLDHVAAASMLDELRGARLLDGVRGGQPVDRAAVVSMLVALGRLGVERPDLLEVDLNPVIASAAGAVAVDALGRPGRDARWLTSRSCEPSRRPGACVRSPTAGSRAAARHASRHSTPTTRSGIIHTESATPEPNTLGQLFVEWGVRLSETCVGEYCSPATTIAVYVDGEPVTGDPNAILLTDQREIAIVIGTPPAQIPKSADFSHA